MFKKLNASINPPVEPMCDWLDLCIRADVCGVDNGCGKIDICWIDGCISDQA